MNPIAAARRFSQAESPQSGSRLLQLPAEIRILILRYFLRQPNVEVEDELEDIQRDVDITVGFRLMHTCQLMYREGESIFFDENTLDLNASFDGVGQVKLVIKSNLITMTAEVDINQSIQTYCPIAADANVGSDQVSIELRGKVLTTGQRQTYMSMLTGFQRVKINVTEDGGHRTLLAVCRLLEPLVRGSNVEINYNLGPRGLSELYSCRWLQCATLTINDSSGNNSQAASLFSQNWRPGQATADTYTDWYRVFSKTLSKLPVIDNIAAPLNFFEQHEGRLKEMAANAMEYDSIGFAQHLDWLDQAILAWCDQWWQQELTRIQFHRRQVQNAVRESDGIVDRQQPQSLSSRVTQAIALTAPIDD